MQASKGIGVPFFTKKCQFPLPPSLSPKTCLLPEAQCPQHVDQHSPDSLDSPCVQHANQLDRMVLGQQQLGEDGGVEEALTLEDLQRRWLLQKYIYCI
jgi:hypothetical protein